MKRADFKKDREYDIIVIGGGITGAAVAYDASFRGLSVALVEMDDFGSKTSTATSKLIHGGLRYLANLEFGLVRESLRERKTLENIAPNFVYPIPNMLLTDKASIKSRKSILKIGMILYDLLSFDKKFTWDRSKSLPWHRSLSLDETIKAEPAIKKEGLTGSLVYYDCASIYPERLTLAFIKSAVANNADVANYMEVKGFLRENNCITGISVLDKISKRNKTIKGRIVINCGGPWADRILSFIPGNTHKEVLRRSEGIHIITRQPPGRHLITAMTPSGRHIFIIPWRGHSLIGTTDKEYIGSPDNWKISRESIEELISEINQSFGPERHVDYDDIVFCYGGLRPLVEDQTEDVYESSRKYEISDHSTEGLQGLITVEGGKYTTSRNLAENVMKIACKKLGLPPGPSGTEKHYLTGSEIEDMEEFVLYNRQKYKETDEITVDYLSRIYGMELEEIMKLSLKHKKSDAPLTKEMHAQIEFAVKEEMAYTLNDILFRRTGFGNLGHPGKKQLKLIASFAGKLLKWDAKRLKNEIALAEEIFRLP